MITSCRLTDGAPTGVFGEDQHETITILNHDLALFVDAVLRTVQDRGTAASQLLSQGVHCSDLDIGVARALGAARANLAPARATEEHLHAVASHDPEHRRGLRAQTDACPIPVAENLKAEHVPIVLGGLDNVGYRELRRSRLKANCRSRNCLH